MDSRGMGLWQRAAGMLKDQSSIWQANMTRRTALRNPDIEKAVIHATTHCELSFDRRNLDRACEWIRLSPYNLKPLLWSVSNRMEKTRDWVVALKGLYLMHTLANCRVPCVRQIGRLPFDLSNFKDGHGSLAKTWALNAFVRAYYAFLDQKSTLVFQLAEEKAEGFSIKQELVVVCKLQGLADLLMQIRPQAKAVFVPIVVDVMDGIINEIYDIYSMICRGIAIVLVNIYSATKAEATIALNVVRKATQQSQDLSDYFQFCQEIGVVGASEFPVIDRIPEEGIEELEEIIKSFSNRPSVDEFKQRKEKAIVVREAETNTDKGKHFCRDELRTIITDKWERFDEDFVPKNPFGSPLMTYTYGSKNQEMPDLISFL